jgi:hypothetical protein
MIRASSTHHTQSSLFHTCTLLQSEDGSGQETSSTGTDLDGGTREGSGLGGGGSSTAGRLGAVGHHGARGGRASTAGHGGVGLGGLHGGRVGGAGGHGGEKAGVVLADALELSTLGRNDNGGGSAADIEDGVEGLANNSNIVRGDTEGGGSEGNLLDEVADLCSREVHESVDSGLRAEASVAGEASGRAAKESTEVLVQVGHELVLVGGSAVGRHVHGERDGTTIVKEVDGDTGAATTVGGGKTTVEVGEEVDLSAHVGTLGKNTGDGVHVGLGVVTNDNSVDEESQEGQLVGTGVLLEESSGVLVADGHVLGECRSSGGSKAGNESGGTHIERE